MLTREIKLMKNASLLEGKKTNKQPGDLASGSKYLANLDTLFRNPYFVGFEPPSTLTQVL